MLSVKHNAINTAVEMKADFDTSVILVAVWKKDHL